MPHTNAYRQIVRIFLPLNNENCRVKETIDFCREINCREVMLFTGLFDNFPCFATLDELRERTRNILKPAIDTWHDAGLKVNINVIQTLGHQYFPNTPEYRAKFPFQERITIHGTGGDGACPIDENLRHWVRESYALFASLKPEYLFVDDDFRTMMKGGISCFCPKHLKEISRLAGKSITIDEVADAIFNQPDSPLKQYYFDVTTDGFVSLAKEIHAAVKAVSPETRIGLMSAVLPHATMGVDLEKVLLALAGNDRPLLRPQVSLYGEVMIHEFPALVFNPSLMRASLPENTEHFAELESTPYGTAAKSAAMTAAHAFALLMQGFPTQAFTFFDTLGHPLPESDKLIKAFASYNKFFNKVAGMIPENSRTSGINTVVGKNILRFRHAKKANFFNDRELALALPNCGLPLGTDPDSPFQVLTGDDLRSMEHNKIDRLLQKGALMDIPALNALHDLGFGERIGIRCGKRLAADDIGMEEFNFGFGPEFDSTKSRHPLRFFYYDEYSSFHALESDNRAVAWSEIYNYLQQKIAPGLLVRENEAGERFAVIPSLGDICRRFLCSYDRTRQFRKLFSYIARRPLPLAVTGSAPYIWCLLNRGKDGQWYAGVINCSTDCIDELPLAAGKEFARGLTQITADGEIPVDHTIPVPDPDGSGAMLYSVKVNLAPMQFALFKALE